MTERERGCGWPRDDLAFRSILKAKYTNYTEKQWIVLQSSKIQRRTHSLSLSLSFLQHKHAPNMGAVIILRDVYLSNHLLNTNYNEVDSYKNIYEEWHRISEKQMNYSQDVWFPSALALYIYSWDVKRAFFCLFLCRGQTKQTRIHIDLIALNILHPITLTLNLELTKQPIYIAVLKWKYIGQYQCTVANVGFFYIKPAHTYYFSFTSNLRRHLWTLTTKKVSFLLNK